MAHAAHLQDRQSWLKTQASVFASFVKSVLDVCMTPGAANPDAPACDRLAIDLVRIVLPSLHEPITPTSLTRVVMQVDVVLARFGSRQSAQAQTVSKLWHECVLAQFYRDSGPDRLIDFLIHEGGKMASSIMVQPSCDEVNEVLFTREGKDFDNCVVIRIGRTTLRMNQYTLARLVDVAMAFNNVRPRSCSVELPSPIKVVFGPEMT